MFWRAMTDSDKDLFVRDLTQAQAGLYAYILGLVHDANATADVLQETNMVLWKKADHFTLGTNFVAWAKSVAHLEILAYRKRRSKDRHLFNDELVEQMAAVMEESTAHVDVRLIGLRDCLEKLSENHRRRIEKRYEPGAAVQEIARDNDQSVGAVSQLLYRIRKQLMTCVEESLGSEHK